MTTIKKGLLFSTSEKIGQHCHDCILFCHTKTDFRKSKYNYIYTTKDLQLNENILRVTSSKRDNQIKWELNQRVPVQIIEHTAWLTHSVTFIDWNEYAGLFCFAFYFARYVESVTFSHLGPNDAYCSNFTFSYKNDLCFNIHKCC